MPRFPSIARLPWRDDVQMLRHPGAMHSPKARVPMSSAASGRLIVRRCYEGELSVPAWLT